MLLVIFSTIYRYEIESFEHTPIIPLVSQVVAERLNE